MLRLSHPLVRILIVIAIVVSAMLPVLVPLAHAQQTASASSLEGASATAPQGVSCTGWSVWPTCIFRAIVAGFGALLMYIGIQMATLSSALFEFALRHLIVEFGALLKLIMPGIEAGWVALRDIANIVIIGLFVFIAINIILGVSEFGDHKKVAKVLIVATLINFSLVFSKAIIDASNFTAYHFYNSMVKGLDQPAAAGSADMNNLGKGGIAGKFMQLIGISGLGDSYQTLRDAQEGQKDWFAGFWLGLFSFVLLLGVAAVLAYGTFLIASRAILLVLLMITSALAFASWLIPQHYIEKGFEKWWESLLKSAFFAPIMMALIWCSVVVADAIVNSAKLGSGGTLGKVVANPSSDANLGAMFGMVLVIGLLFAAFKASSGLASSIPGFKIGAGIPAIAAGMVGRVGGVMGRYGVGLPADYFRSRVSKRARALMRSDSKLDQFAGKALARSVVSPLTKVAERDFNMMNTALGKEIAATSGLKGVGETNVGGIIGAQKKMAELYKKMGDEAALKREDVQHEVEHEMRTDGGKSKKELTQELRDALEREEPRRLEGEEKKAVQMREKNDRDEKRTRMKEEWRALEDERRSLYRMWEKEGKPAASDTKTALDKKTQDAHDKQELISEQDNKINEINNELRRLDTEYFDESKTAKKELEFLQARIDRETEVRMNQAPSAGEIAERLTNTRASNAFGAWRAPDNDPVVKELRKLTHGDSQSKRLLSLVKQILDNKSIAPPPSDKK